MRSPTCAAQMTSCACGWAASARTRSESSFAAPAGGEIDPAEPELSQALRDLTEGNAFLLCELWRALVETDAFAIEDGTLRLTRAPARDRNPQSVREVVSQRLSRLDPASRDLLELAAVAGPEFELDVLRRAAPVELERIDALEPAMRSGMIEELPFPALAYRFTHELVRRALYDRLSVLRRAELHLRIAEALEESSGRGTGRLLADLAHHFAAAAPIGGAGASGRVQPPRRAMRHPPRWPTTRPPTVCARRWKWGCKTSASAPMSCSTWVQRCFRAGKAVDALQAFRQAADIARDLGDAELLAQAAIGFETACWRPGIADEGAGELLEEAAAALGEEIRAAGRPTGGSRSRTGVPGRLRAGRGCARRTRSRWHAGLDDRLGLATALMGSYWARASTSLAQALEMLGEARDLARNELGDMEMQTEAIPGESRRSSPSARSCLPGGVRSPSTAAEHTPALHAPCDRALRLGARAAATGDLAEAEAAGVALARVGPTAGGPRRLRRVRNPDVRRPPRAGTAGRARPGDHGSWPARARHGPWRPGFVALLAELGMEPRPAGADRCRRGLDRCRGRSGSPRSPTWRTPAGASRRGGRRPGLSRSAARRREHDDRALRLLLRRRRSLPRDARRDTRRPDRAAGHFEAALELNRQHGRRDLARPHRLRVRTPDASQRRETPIAQRRCSARPRRWPSGWGCPHCSRAPGPGAGVSARRPMAFLPARCRSSPGRPRRSATGRSGPRSRSASTPPPTTCAAFSARPAAPTAPRPPPTPTGAAWPRAERWRSIQHMPMYVIERAFAEQLDLISDDVKLIEEINADEGVRWLFSFLSADRRRSYCLYEAPSPDMIVLAAKRAGIPADAVVEVNRISADMYV